MVCKLRVKDGWMPRLPTAFVVSMGSEGVIGRIIDMLDSAKNKYARRTCAERLACESSNAVMNALRLMVLLACSLRIPSPSS